MVVLFGVQLLLGLSEEERLRQMQRALENHEEKLFISSTPISSALAQLISDLLLLPRNNEEWTVVVSGSDFAESADEDILPETELNLTFIGCYPVDDNSSQILQNAFQQVKMRSLVICGMDSSNDNHQRLMQVIFAGLPAVAAIDNNPVASSLEHLIFEGVMSVENQIPMINRWLCRHTNIAAVSVFSWNSINRNISASQFLVRAFQGVPHIVSVVKFYESQIDHIDEISQWPSLGTLHLEDFASTLNTAGNLSSFTSLNCLELTDLSVPIEDTHLLELL